MLFVPLPFVVAFFLLFLLARMIREGGTAHAIRPFLLLIGGTAIVSIIIGLRWGYGFSSLQPVMPVLASALPPLTWIAFSGLASENRWSARRALHFLPVLLVAALIPVAPALLDGLIFTIFFAYGAALLWLGARGPDALTGVAFDRSGLVHWALITAGVMLIMSAAVDLFIAIDFALAKGAHVPDFIAAANVLNLIMLGIAASIAGPSQPPDESAAAEDTGPAGANDEERAIADQIEKLVVEKQLYRDPDLTLTRLARKAVIPARRISNAINRTRHESVSQYINGHRITEACRLLAETEKPVTAVMFDSGFQTKSNFNREFLRRMGMGPAEWRCHCLGQDRIGELVKKRQG